MRDRRDPLHARQRRGAVRRLGRQDVAHERRQAVHDDERYGRRRRTVGPVATSRVKIFTRTGEPGPRSAAAPPSVAVAIAVPIGTREGATTGRSVQHEHARDSRERDQPHDVRRPDRRDASATTSRPACPSWPRPRRSPPVSPSPPPPSASGSPSRRPRTADRRPRASIRDPNDREETLMSMLVEKVNADARIAALPLDATGPEQIGATSPVLATPAAFAAGLAGAAAVAGAVAGGAAIGNGDRLIPTRLRARAGPPARAPARIRDHHADPLRPRLRLLRLDPRPAAAPRSPRRAARRDHPGRRGRPPARAPRPRERLASWHVVDDAGRLHSGGPALVPVLSALPGGAPFAALLAARRG